MTRAAGAGKRPRSYQPPGRVNAALSPAPRPRRSSRSRRPPSRRPHQRPSSSARGTAPGVLLADAAAVEDRDLLADSRRNHAIERRANDRCASRACSGSRPFPSRSPTPARTRRPSRTRLLRLRPSYTARDLAHQHLGGAIGFALGEGLSHADDGRQSVTLRSARLARHLLVALSHSVPALGVADDHEAAAERRQHRAGDLAREGARGLGWRFWAPRWTPLPRSSIRTASSAGERRTDRDLAAATAASRA
jgi:hypothetical protein